MQLEIPWNHTITLMQLVQLEIPLNHTIKLVQLENKYQINTFE